MELQLASYTSHLTVHTLHPPCRSTEGIEARPIEGAEDDAVVYEKHLVCNYTCGVTDTAWSKRYSALVFGCGIQLLTWGSLGAGCRLESRQADYGTKFAGEAIQDARKRIEERLNRDASKGVYSEIRAPPDWPEPHRSAPSDITRFNDPDFSDIDLHMERELCDGFGVATIEEDVAAAAVSQPPPPPIAPPLPPPPIAPPLPPPGAPLLTPPANAPLLTPPAKVATMWEQFMEL